MHDQIKDSQNKNQVNCNCVKTKNLLKTAKNRSIWKCVKALIWVRLDCLTPYLRENASLLELIKDSQNKNQVNFNCVKTKNLLETTREKFICNCVKAVLGNKAVQNMFSCAFPIFRSIIQKIRICLQDEVLLGSRNIRSPRPTFLGNFAGTQDQILSWAP